MSALTDTIDTAVTALLPQIQTCQNNYARSHNGKYFQGIRTPNPIPADGADGILDKTLHPTDQVEDWIVFGLTLPTRQTWALEIRVYDSPSGPGYVVGSWVVEGIRTKVRGRNFGPDTSRDTAWINV